MSEADGGAALDRLMAERAVDLVVLDINMPGEDGVSIARRLRARGRVGIVMLTANAETLDRVVGLEVGTYDYVAKPFDPRELLARIRAVIRRASPAYGGKASLGARWGGSFASAARCSTSTRANWSRRTAPRCKIEQDPAKPQVLKTIRGVGYAFTPGQCD